MVEGVDIEQLLDNKILQMLSRVNSTVGFRWHFFSLSSRGG